VIRKNLPNTNLSLDEGKTDREREKEARIQQIYIYTPKKERQDHFQFTIDMMIVQSKYSIFFSLI
jgi:hypothetical protein